MVLIARCKTRKQTHKQKQRQKIRRQCYNVASTQYEVYVLSEVKYTEAHS